METGARVVLDLCIFVVTQPFLLKITNHKLFLQESPKIYKYLFKNFHVSLDSWICLLNRQKFASSVPFNGVEMV